MYRPSYNTGMSKSYIEPSLSEKVRSNLSKSINFSNPTSYMKNVREELNKIKNRNNLSHTTINMDGSLNDNIKIVPKKMNKPYNNEQNNSYKNLNNNNIDTNTNTTSNTTNMASLSVKKKSANHNVNDNDNVNENDNVNDNAVGNDFKHLSYEDIQVNLRLLSDLKEGEKLMIKDNRYIVVDDRFGLSLWRFFSDDSRIRSLDFISHVIEESGRYCSDAVKQIKMNSEKKANMEKLIKIQSLLTSSQTGLSRLIETYSDDKLSRAKIETIINTINTYKDKDLKKAIE